MSKEVKRLFRMSVYERIRCSDGIAIVEVLSKPKKRYVYSGEAVWWKGWVWGNHAYAMELQNARKLVEKGCWSVRRANPYLEHIAECIASTRPHEGKLTLEETQRLMRECALRWRKLSKEE